MAESLVCGLQPDFRLLWVRTCANALGMLISARRACGHVRTHKITNRASLSFVAPSAFVMASGASVSIFFLQGVFP
jgi:hypothetical protein